jgi:hypothetical protein
LISVIISYWDWQQTGVADETSVVQPICPAGEYSGTDCSQKKNNKNNGITMMHKRVTKLITKRLFNEQ